MKNKKAYLCFILNIKENTLNKILTESQYHQFEIPKKSGGVRKIAAPDKNLKRVQEKLNQYILKNYNFLDCQIGFVPKKSIIENAKIHCQANYIVNIDLKNFFPSINFGRVRGVFTCSPFYFNTYEATILAKIACFHNELPQGSPCSPSISNIICYTLDQKMLKLASDYHFQYTRYADDITLSSDNPFKKEIIEKIDNHVILGKKLRNIIENQGFIINEKKTHYSMPKERKEVTGLIVNEKINVKKVYVKQLRSLLHHCSQDGLSLTASHYFHRSTSKKEAATRIKKLQKVIEGRLNFLAMVRGNEDLVYQKYLKQYLEILHKEGIYSISIRKKVKED